MSDIGLQGGSSLPPVVPDPHAGPTELHRLSEAYLGQGSLLLCHDSMLVGANQFAHPDTLRVCVEFLIYLAGLFPTVTFMLSVNLRPAPLRTTSGIIVATLSFDDPRWQSSFDMIDYSLLRTVASFML